MVFKWKKKMEDLNEFGQKAYQKYWDENELLKKYLNEIRDCAIIIRRGAEKLEGGHYIKLLPR